MSDVVHGVVGGVEEGVGGEERRLHRVHPRAKYRLVRRGRCRGLQGSRVDGSGTVHHGLRWGIDVLRRTRRPGWRSPTAWSVGFRSEDVIDHE